MVRRLHVRLAEPALPRTRRSDRLLRRPQSRGGVSGEQVTWQGRVATAFLILCLGLSLALVIFAGGLLDAEATVAPDVHRHHGRVQGCKFSIGVVDGDGTLRGVAIVGRPTARHRDDGATAEVTRLATDGCPNACSALYAASWRTARAMGYRRLGTYILDSEPGTSLRAAGWTLMGEAGGGTWNRPNRAREDKHPTQPKLLWEAS